MAEIKKVEPMAIKHVPNIKKPEKKVVPRVKRKEVLPEPIKGGRAEISEARSMYLAGDYFTAASNLKRIMGDRKYTSKGRDNSEILLGDISKLHAMYDGGSKLYQGGRKSEAFKQWIVFLNKEKILDELFIDPAFRDWIQAYNMYPNIEEALRETLLDPEKKTSLKVKGIPQRFSSTANNKFIRL